MREYDIWLSNVTRWHSNTNPRLRMSNDTTQGHQCRVAQLIWLLNPNADKGLLTCALFHDNAEDVVGDVPRGTKCFEHGRYEVEVMDKRGLPMTSNAWLKLCDSLDAYLWCKLHAPEETKRYDWIKHKEAILDMAESLNVRPTVFRMMNR